MPLYIILAVLMLFVGISLLSQGITVFTLIFGSLFTALGIIYLGLIAYAIWYGIEL